MKISSEVGLSVERLTALGRVVSVAPSPCGTWLAVEVSRLDSEGACYISDLWRVSMDKSFEPIRLTWGSSRDKAPWFRRDGSLGFLSNRNPREGKPQHGDDKRFQVWLMPVEGGEPCLLTDEPLGVSSFRFASEGDRLIVLASILLGVPLEKQRNLQADRKKNGPSALHYRSMPIRSWDHWLEEPAIHVISYNEEGRERRDLTPEADREHREASWDLSPDGSCVVVTHQSVLREDFLPDQSLLLLDTQSGGQREIGAMSRISLSAPTFSTDGRTIACLWGKRTSKPSYETGLWLFDVALGEGRPLASSWDRKPTSVLWSSDGRHLFVVAADRGYAPIFQVSLETEDVTRLSSTSCGGTHQCLRCVPGLPSLVGIRHQFRHPPEPFWMPCESEATPTLLANLSGFSPEEGEALFELTDFRTPTDDGQHIQSFLLTPKRPESPLHPWLLWIHGGPMSQWSDGWHWRWNPLVLVSQGYAMALPNPRGSTGEGQAFIDGIWNNQWGGRCYRDLLSVTDALVERDDLDSERYSAMGGSFGGYMVNWLAGHTDRFKCMISHAGLFHFSAFFGTTDMPGWFSYEKALHPFKDTEALELHSPHRFVSEWRTPTLIIHGEKDYRVPISEALLLFNSLQMHGVPSELLVFPDENHWILKPRNIRTWYNTVSAYLQRFL